MKEIDFTGLKISKGGRVFSAKGKQPKIPPHHHRLAHFYVESAITKSQVNKPTHLLVLEEGNMGGVPLDKCNRFEDFPRIAAIQDKFAKMHFDVEAAAFHESAVKICRHFTAFYGHFDKIVFADGVIIFVPIEGSCTLYLAVPRDHKTGLDDDFHNDKARSYLRRVAKDEDEARKFGQFEAQFYKESGCSVDKKLLMYTLRPGDFIAFNASEIFHAVIIHPHLDGMRRLLLLHAIRTARRSDS